MASESSSAVLDLNDADATDTDAPSVMDVDEVPDGAPLIMEHGYDIAVKVDAPMKQLSTLETFVTYRVRCVCARWTTPPHVRRRYNHFKLLHKRLAASHPLVAPPPLPPLHSARQQLDRYSPAFVAVRCLALHSFLAGAAGAARAAAPLRHRAALPALAAYAHAHVDKIRARDALHAAYVSGNNTTDEVHNRLEQASEALRSELSDWIPKTHAEIKSLLLDLADRQVNIHTQTLMGWEHALKLSTDDISEMFKTVSKTAVQNLSPSKCRSLTTPNETEQDIDDIDNYSNDSDIQDVSKDDIQHVSKDDVQDVSNDGIQDSKDESHVHECVKVENGDDYGKLDSISKEDSSKSDSRFSDPLQEFSEVDLS
nr:sorting nexin-30-like [Vanessa tameamea]